jgi:iron(III) transport system permease protein
MRIFNLRGTTLVFCVALFLFLISPVIPIVYQAFLDKPIYDATGTLGLGNFSRLLQDGAFLEATENTFYFAALSTVISLALGLVLSLLFERVNLPLRKTLRLLFLAPIFISPLILSFAWSMLYGPGGYVSLFMRANLGFGLPNLYSIEGMSLIAGLSQAPISYLFFAAAAANIPNDLERSARISGAGPLRTIATIVIPLLKPAILSCAVLNFMLVVDLLAVPLIIGEPARIQVLATYLYTKGLIAAQVDYGIVAAAAVFMIIVVQLLVWVQTRWIGDTRRYVTVGGRSGRSTRAKLGATGWVITGVIGLFVLVTSIVPTAFLILRSFTSLLSPLLPIADVLTLANYDVIFSREQYVRSIWNTLIIAFVGGFGALILTFVAAVFAYRTLPFARTLIEQVSVIPRAVPGLVVGLGFFYAVMLMPGGDWLRQTIIILMIAFTIRYFPTGFGALTPAFLQIGSDLDRAVRVSGGSRWAAVRDVTLPLTKTALVGAFMLYFIHFFKEYSAASFLFSPGTEVIGTTMLQLNLVGHLGSLAALAVIQLVITVPLAVFIYSRG